MRPAHCNGTEMLDQLSCLRETAVLKKMDVLNACVAKRLFLYEAFPLKIIIRELNEFLLIDTHTQSLCFFERFLYTSSNSGFV